MDFSRLYSRLIQLHAFIPWRFGSTWALPPVFAQIEVTHRCNAGCAVCYQRTKLAPKNELTPGEVRGIIDQLPSWCVVSLTGGEPFSREDFPEILADALERRKCTLLTNASLVTDGDIDLLVRKGLLLMAVSIDGMEETHDGIRKSPGLFARAVETIRKVQEKKRELKTRFPLIDMKAVILKENVGELSAMLRLAESLSADFVTYSVPRATDSLYSAPYRDNLGEICGGLPPYPSLDEADLEVLKREVSWIRRHSGRTRVRFYPANLLQGGRVERFYRQDIFPRDFRSCALPWSRLSVSPHGDVYPCLSYRVGNVREERLAAIWNGPRFREFRRCLDRRSLSPFCLGCCNSVCSLPAPGTESRETETKG